MKTQSLAFDVIFFLIKGSIVIISKIWKQPKRPSIDEGIKKMWYTHRHTHNDMLLTHKKEILPFETTWMKPEGIMLRARQIH